MIFNTPFQVVVLEAHALQLMDPCFRNLHSQYGSLRSMEQQTAGICIHMRRPKAHRETTTLLLWLGLLCSSLSGHEHQPNTIDAVALVGRRFETFTFKDMAKMSIAFSAEYFDAHHAQANILLGDDVLSLRRIVK